MRNALATLSIIFIIAWTVICIYTNRSMKEYQSIDILLFIGLFLYLCQMFRDIKIIKS